MQVRCDLDFQGFTSTVLVTENPGRAGTNGYPLGIADHPCAPHPVVERGVRMARHPEAGVNQPDKGLIVVDEIRIETVFLVLFIIKRTQGGRKVRDDHVDLAGQPGDTGTDLLVFRYVAVGVPTQRHPEILYHRAVIEMVRVPPKIRAPLRAVEAQALNLHRVIVEIVKPGVPLGVVAPEGVHFPFWGVVVLVVARHEDHRGELELAADERQAVVPVAVHDVAGQDEQVPVLVGRELALPVRQVPFPQLEVEIRCDLDFHAVPIIVNRRHGAV